MTTLVYYYLIDKQFNNLFQLLNDTKNMEFLGIRMMGELQINRTDLARKTLSKMKAIEEDNCLIVVCQAWLSLHDPKAPLQTCEQIINNLNELSQKFGYTIKTYNILGIVLMIQGEIDKASQIFENALVENDIYNLIDNGTDE